MPLLLKTHYQLAKQSLRRNRIRSLLTCLGIAIGVASLTLILSFAGSITQLVSSQVSPLGEGLAIIRPSRSQTTVDSVISELTQSAALQSSSLSLNDISTIREIKNVENVAPISVSNLSVHANNIDIPSVPILATTSDFSSIQHYSLSSGIFLGGKSQENSVVLGHSFASSVFGNEPPVGKTLEILGQRFIIIGVLGKIEDPINFNNINLDYSIIMDANYFAKSLPVPLQISQINIRLAETSLLSSTISEIKSTLETSKKDSNFTILSGSEITHPSGSLLEIITFILTLISAISLVVGGIGIMNIMLVSVTERTHEIGIRKAVGATNFNIFGEFVIESLLLSIKGGILGILIGYALAFGASLITPFAPFISWQIIALTLATAIITGLIFGIFPALHAAKKDPIRSLKSYY